MWGTMGKKLLLAMYLATIASSAHAGVWLQSSLAFLRSEEQTGKSSASITNQILTSSSIGYTFRQGFFLGTQGLTSRNSHSGEFLWAIGPKGGFLLSGFELTSAYLPFARDTLGAVRRSGGGFAVNLGYSWSLIKGVVLLGIHGTYWLTNLTEENDTALSDKIQIRHLSPQLALGFHF